MIEEQENKLEFWVDGEYNARGGYYIRNNLKDFFKKLIDVGLEPVGVIVDMESYNVEVVVKQENE